MATVCKLGGGGASKKKIAAAQRLEGAYIFSAGVITEASTGDGGRIRTVTVTCPADSEFAYLVFFSEFAHGNEGGSIYSFETNGTFVKTLSGSTKYDYMQYNDGGSLGTAFGIVILEPGQYIDLTPRESGYYRASATHAFVIKVPIADT